MPTAKLISRNPSRNFEILGEVNASTKRDVKDIVQKARDVLPQWSSLSLEKRCKLIYSFIRLVPEQEAIELVNDTIYGLTAHVFTNDKKRFQLVARQLQSGSVAQNMVGYWNPENPFGGYKKSGMGRLHGSFGFHEVTQVKLVAEDK